MDMAANTKELTERIYHSRRIFAACASCDSMAVIGRVFHTYSGETRK